jgi:Resolvase, N terminal domain
MPATSSAATSFISESTDAKRVQLEAAIDYCREGDVLTCTKIDRLARSVAVRALYPSFTASPAAPFNTASAAMLSAPATDEPTVTGSTMAYSLTYRHNFSYHEGLRSPNVFSKGLQ